MKIHFWECSILSDLFFLSYHSLIQALEVKPLWTNCSHYIETTPFICIANQLTPVAHFISSSSCASTLHHFSMLVIAPQTLDHLEYPDGEEENTTIAFNFLKRSLFCVFTHLAHRAKYAVVFKI